MQFNYSTKSSTPFRWFAFLPVVFLLDATLSVQAFQVTNFHFIGQHTGIYEAKEVGANTNTLLVKTKWHENFPEDYLKLEHSILRDIERETAAVPEKYRPLVLLAPKYKDLQRNVPLPGGFTAKLALVFPLLNEGHLRYLLEKATNNAQEFPITKASVLSISRSILNGLKLLHHTGYVHGNIKPSSIWLQHRSRNELSASIGDFSRASKIGEVANRGLSSMTEGYAPPEQYKQGGLVPRTAAFDVFSFGSLFYQLALGEYVNETNLRSLQSNSSTLRVPEAVRSIVKGCWHKNPQKRLTIDQILEALDVYALDNVFHSTPNL